MHSLAPRLFSTVLPATADDGRMKTDPQRAEGTDVPTRDAQLAIDIGDVAGHEDFDGGRQDFDKGRSPTIEDPLLRGGHGSDRGRIRARSCDSNKVDDGDNGCAGHGWREWHSQDQENKIPAQPVQEDASRRDFAIENRIDLDSRRGVSLGNSRSNSGVRISDPALEGTSGQAKDLPTQVCNVHLLQKNDPRLKKTGHGVAKGWNGVVDEGQREKTSLTAITAQPCRDSFTSFEILGNSAQKTEESAQISPPAHLLLAWFSFCCCCCPIGAIAILRAYEVPRRVKAGDFEGAVQSSTAARKWSMVAIAVGFVYTLARIGVYMFYVRRSGCSFFCLL